MSSIALRVIAGSIFYLSILSCPQLTLGESPKIDQDKPNILMIFLDDFGWRDTSYMGSDFYETPHLDKLAKSGMVFSNAYSCAANCAPARACLLSGQYTPRHSIYNVGTRPRGKSTHRRLEHVPGVDTLDPAIQTWAQQLQKAGYQTASIGKWHLSDDPIPYGFNVNVGGTHSGSPPRGYYPPHNNIPSLKGAPKDEYLTDRLTNEACQFIEDNQAAPWMVYLTHFAVHTPIQPKKELVQKYEGKEPGQLHNNVKMATMIQAVDDGVGKIIETLERLKIRDKTVILFYSDNGGYGPATDMAPLKGYKGTYYEGGIRVPFFVNWPGRVAPGTESNEPITGVDLYPTLCDIAGASTPASQAIDGKSLLPLFEQKTKSFDTGGIPRSLYWHFPAYLDSYGQGHSAEQQDALFRSRPCSIIRRGPWKLMQFFETGNLELYHLSNDIGEANNVAEQNPQIVAELLNDLQSWQTKVKAVIPVKPNPDFSPAEERAAIEARGKKPNKKKKQGSGKNKSVNRQSK